MLVARWRDASGHGLEHCVMHVTDDGVVVESVIVGGEASFGLRYRIACDSAWRVRALDVELVGDVRSVHLLSDGAGTWWSAGVSAPQIAGAIDVDITATPFTNTLPIRRLGLEDGQSVEILVAACRRGGTASIRWTATSPGSSMWTSTASWCTIRTCSNGRGFEKEAGMAFDGEAFVARFNEVWNGHAIEGILEQMTDDVVFEASFGKDPWGTRVTGKPAVRVFLEQMMDRIPDIRWDEIRHFAHPNQVTVEWLTSGTPKNAPAFKVEGCDILTIRDGKIAAKRSYRKGQPI